jgi:murein DD-endopeptidase MepM/ murein hydrolase activator NlpD
MLAKRFFYGMCLLLCLQLLWSMSANPRYITPSDRYHIVVKGETLSGIARQHNLTVRKLMIYNTLSTDRIYIGQKIYLNPKPSRKQEYVTVRSIPKSGYHITKQQESLHRVAKMYDLTVFDLMEYNQLSSWDVSVGTKLWLVKNNASATPSGAHSTGKKHPASSPEHATTPPKKSIPKSPPKSSTTTPPKPHKPSSLTIPAQGVVTSEFGMRNGRPHKGIDIAASPGDPIFAVDAGKVVFAGSQRGYGNVIILEHSNMIMTVYAHNEANLVRLGDTVKKGQPIASMGSTGTSSGPHLHFEYRVQGKAMNPRTVLPPITENK